MFAHVVQVHKGYPLRMWARVVMCAAYDPNTGVIKTNTSDVQPSAVDFLNGTHLLLTTSSTLLNIDPGDHLAVSHLLQIFCHAFLEMTG